MSEPVYPDPQTYEQAQVNALTKERDELRIQLSAWHEVFNTTQLSHASAEFDVLRVEAKHLRIEKEQAEAKVKVLMESLNSIMQLIDNGVLVRDTQLDGRPNWEIAQLPLVKALVQANKALAETATEEESK